MREHPGIVLPPDYLMYESFQLDYTKYYNDSIVTASWLKAHFEKHASLYNINILDWGCGPARIIRHLPALIGNQCLFFGTDYNTNTIRWCSKHIPGVNFTRNELTPPLDYNDQFFHIIYGISIFTHLSEPMHTAWIQELSRILVPGGILLVTTQGNAFRVKLSRSERSRFDKEELVIRGKVKEGHRTFSAFQPPAYFRKILFDFDVLEHIERESPVRPQQDVWILRKKATPLPAQTS